MKRICSAVFLVMTMAFNAIAQDTIMLEAVEVKARASVPLVERQMAQQIDTLVLKNQSMAPVSELLMRHSPVFIKTYGPGGLSTASFRGTTASHTLVLWNGFQLNAPTMGQVDFSTIPVFLADDIGLKWGSKTSENSGGLGGVVNIDNSSGFGRGPLVDIKQSYGSFNTLGSHVTAGYYGRTLSFRVKTYRNSSDNDYEYENTAVIPHATMKQQNASFVDYGLMAEAHCLTRLGVFSVVTWNQHNNRNLPPIMPNVGSKNSTEWTEDGFSRNFIAFRSFWPTGSIKLKSAVFAENQNYFLETRNPITDDVVTYINSKNKSLVLHEIAELEQKITEKWSLDAKLQYDDERVKSNNYQDVKRRNTLSAYAAVRGGFLKNDNIRITVRNDVVDGENMGCFYTFTYGYRLPKPMGMSLNCGYSYNYRNPSLNDLYWYPGGNENLLPEKGRTIDFALKYARSEASYRYEMTCGAYVSRVDNWIQWVPTSYRFWIPENIAQVLARGVETHFNTDFSIRDANVSLSGNYVYTHTTDESPNSVQNNTNGKQLIYIPKHHANMFAEVRLGLWTVSYTLEVTGVRSTSFSVSSPTSSLPAYVLHHSSVGRKIRKFTLDVRCNNITDKDYQNVIWRAMPGRSYEVVLNYKL